MGGGSHKLKVIGNELLVFDNYWDRGFNFFKGLILNRLTAL